jgi:O-antigen ligase
MVALCFGVVLLTGSRFTTVALVATLAGLAGARLARRSVAMDRRATIALGAIAILVIGTMFSGVVRDRFTLFTSGFRERLQIWSHLIDLANASPLTGYGLGSFSALHGHFAGTPRYAEATWTINSAHDLILQLLLQAGWPYALLLLAAAGVVARQVIERRRAAGWNHDDGAIIAAIGLVGSCAMVDVVLDMPAPVTAMLFLAGLLWGYRLDDLKSASPRRAVSHRRRNGS